MASSGSDGGSLEDTLRRWVEEEESKNGPGVLHLPCSSRSNEASFPFKSRSKPARKPRHRNPVSLVEAKGREARAPGLRQGSIPKLQQQRRSSKGNIKVFEADESNLRDLVFKHTSKPTSPPPAAAAVLMQPSKPQTSPPTALSHSSTSMWRSPSEPALVSRSQPTSPKTHATSKPTRPFTSQPTSPLSQYSTASPWSPLHGDCFNSNNSSPQNPCCMPPIEAYTRRQSTFHTYPHHATWQDTGTPMAAMDCLDVSAEDGQANSLAYLQKYLLGN